MDRQIILAYICADKRVKIVRTSSAGEIPERGSHVYFVERDSKYKYVALSIKGRVQLNKRQLTGG